MSGEKDGQHHGHDGLDKLHQSHHGRTRRRSGQIDDPKALLEAVGQQVEHHDALRRKSIEQEVQEFKKSAEKSYKKRRDSLGQQDGLPKIVNTDNDEKLETKNTDHVEKLMEPKPPDGKFDSQKKFGSFKELKLQDGHEERAEDTKQQIQKKKPIKTNAKRKSGAQPRQRRASVIIGRQRNEFLVSLEFAYELTDRCKTMPTVNRIFDCLLGMQFNLAMVNIEKKSNKNDSEESRLERLLQASSLVQSQSNQSSRELSLAHGLSKIILTEHCWATIDVPCTVPQRLPALMNEYRDTMLLLEKWFEKAVRDPRVSFPSILEYRQNDEYLNCVVILDALIAIHSRVFTALRPCMANVETFFENREPVNELPGLEATALIRCVSSKEYNIVEEEALKAVKAGPTEVHIEVPVPNNDDVDGVNNTIMEGNENDDENDEETLVNGSKRASISSRRGSDGKNSSMKYSSRKRRMSLVNTEHRLKVMTKANEKAEDVVPEKPQKESYELEDLHLVFDGLKTSLTEGEEKEGSGKINAVDSLFHSLIANNLNNKYSSLRRHTAMAVKRNRNISLLDGESKHLVLPYVQKRTLSLLWVEELVDMYTLCICVLVSILSLAELLKLDDVVQDSMARAHVLASQIIRAGLPLIERVLDFEPNLLRFYIRHLTLKGLGSPDRVDKIMYKLVYKFRIINSVLSGFDVHLFPRTIDVHEGAVRNIVVSHLDPEIAMTCGDDRLLRIWDLRTGRCMALFAGHKSVVSWCGFSSDDRIIISASFDTTLKVWDSKSGRCKCTLSGHTDSVLDAAISSNDKLLISSSMDGTVRLWSLGSSICYRVYKGHASNAWIKRVCFLPDDSGFVSCGLDGRIVLWSLEAPAKRVVYVEEDAPDVYEEVEVTDDEADNEVDKPASEDEAQKTSEEGEGAEEGKPPKKTKFILRKKKGEKKIKEVEEEGKIQPSHIYVDVHTNYILDALVIPAEMSTTRTHLLLTVSKDCTQCMLDLEEYSRRKYLPSLGAVEEPSSTAGKETPQQQDRQVNNNKQQQQSQGQSWGTSLALSANGKLFAIGASDNTIYIYQTSNACMIRQLRVHNSGITKILFSKDSRFVFVGTSSGSVQIISL